MPVPENLTYTSEHEWLLIDGDTATVGITNYAADQLGDVVFVELPEVDDAMIAGAVVGEIESTKSVGELLAPANGSILESNRAVAESPELVNSDPFGAGWLVRVRLDAAPEGLLSAAEYDALVGE
ncbi:glycine cleavage system protein GcvH [Klugiella xanthotipulae]|uniref:Glycine cleavage system H protein n=1 Tax=Klugiella xanthotipulae TaxID=244735 RepID=A0A543HXG4_9MICO|nr:glycine cleavage system protein GcvH [Klugiella xanthotipulae]TQM63054.1 glycine cleavage system H protein [Klugiella xanthotipulae]